MDVVTTYFMTFLKRYIKFSDNLSEHTGTIISWLTTILVLLVSYDVFSRYLLKESMVAIQELEWHIFAIIFLMGAGYTLKEEKHVRVDILYSKLSPERKAVINVIGSLLFLIPFCLMVIYTTKDFVMNSFSMGETSPDPGGLPARFLIKSIIPISFLFILLQGISLLFKSIVTITEKPNKGNN